MMLKEPLVSQVLQFDIEVEHATQTELTDV